VLLVVLACALMWSMGPGDPFDQFRLIDIVPPNGGEAHAAVFEYHHANSSVTATAVWIIKGERQEAVSAERPTGQPVLVWFGNPKQLQLEYNPNFEPKFSAVSLA
jgi:hypothetical protein